MNVATVAHRFIVKWPYRLGQGNVAPEMHGTKT